MYKYNFFLLTILFFFQSCQTDRLQTHTGQEPAIAALLDRNSAIQMDKEWEAVQNQFAANQQALRNDPDDFEAALSLVEVYIHEARVTGEHGHYYPAALQVLEEVWAKNPEDADVRFRTLAAKAGVQLSLHHFSEALETGKSAIVLNPYNAQIYGVLVDAYVELGEYEKAVLMADKMVAIRPDLRSYSRVSYLREIHGEVDGAIEAMKMAVAAGFPSQEQTAWARLTLGKLYEIYGDLEQAEMQYQLTLQNRENYPFAQGALGQLAMEKEDWIAAEKWYSRALEAIPEFEFMLQLIFIFQEQGRTAEAQEMQKELFASLKDDEENGHRMDLEYAQIYSDLLQDYDQALTYALAEYKRRPDNIDVNRILASIYSKKGENDLAQTHVEAAARTQSAHPELIHLQQLLNML